MPVQTVIDTSILVAAARSRRGASYELIRLFSVADKRWEWNISTAVLVEYESVLKRPENLQGRTPADIDRFLDDVAAKANRHSISFLLRPILTDPKDEFILELAVASASDYIVTHNRDDFRHAVRFGLKVVGPGEFLNLL